MMARTSEQEPQDAASERIKRAVARVSIRQAGREVARGSAFLVAPGIALTAWHVLLDELRRPWPGDCFLVFGSHEVLASVQDHDPAADWAVLSCPADLEIEPVRLGRAPARGGVWRAWGVFADSDGRQLPIRGTVEDPHVAVDPASPESGSAIVLFCAQAAAANGLDVHGLSGAPCVVDGVVVALMRDALTNQARRTVGGYLFACAIEQVVTKVTGFPPLDPCRGLPGYPLADDGPPARPYRYLDAYTEEDAEVFFGRCREIREVFDTVHARSAHVLLLHGQSGVGKSSLLRAGLIPRLRAGATVLYLRAPSLPELVRALDPSENSVSLRQAWSAREADGGDVILILDQAEEYITQVGHARTNQLAVVLDAISQCRPAGGPCAPARGIVILSFRKEWLAEIVAQCQAFGIGTAQCFVRALDSDQIVETVLVTCPPVSGPAEA